MGNFATEPICDKIWEPLKTPVEHLERQIYL